MSPIQSVYFYYLTRDARIASQYSSSDYLSFTSESVGNGVKQGPLMVSFD